MSGAKSKGMKLAESAAKSVKPMIGREEPKVKDRPLSKRDLVKAGEYRQFAVLIPVDLVNRLELLRVQSKIKGDDRDLSDMAAEALEAYLVKHDA